MPERPQQETYVDGIWIHHKKSHRRPISSLYLGPLVSTTTTHFSLAGLASALAILHLATCQPFGTTSVSNIIDSGSLESLTESCRHSPTLQSNNNVSSSPTLQSREDEPIILWQSCILADTEFIHSPSFAINDTARVYQLQWSSNTPLVVRQQTRRPPAHGWAEATISPPGGSQQGAKLYDSNPAIKIAFVMESFSGSEKEGRVGAVKFVSLPAPSLQWHVTEVGSHSQGAATS